MDDFLRQRQHMVNSHVAARGVADPLVLDALLKVPREWFVPPRLAERAYDDGPLPIGFGQTISQPFIVGLMLEFAELREGDRVLEIGTGSGYGAALLSRIVAQVLTIETLVQLAEEATRRLKERGFGNVQVRMGDGALGWEEAAPFDAILVTAAAPHVPAALRNQLKVGGRLIMPIGKRKGQRLKKFVRRSATEFQKQDLGGVSFVPLT